MRRGDSERREKRNEETYEKYVEREQAEKELRKEARTRNRFEADRFDENIIHNLRKPAFIGPCAYHNGGTSPRSSSRGVLRSEMRTNLHHCGKAVTFGHILVSKYNGITGK